MSQEEMHVSLLKEAYKKWHETKAGSAEHWLALMTDDIQFRSLSERRSQNGVHPHEHL
jgi:hypothetical protein